MNNLEIKKFFNLGLLLKKIKMGLIKVINKLEEYDINFSKKIEKENNKYKKFFALLIYMILIFISISLFLTALVALLFLFLFIIVLILYVIGLYFISLFLPLLFILKLFGVISRGTLFKFTIIFIIGTSIITSIFFYLFIKDERDIY